LIERIKQELDPDNPIRTQADSEVGEEKEADFGIIAEAASSPNNIPLVDPNELPSDWEEDTGSEQDTDSPEDIHDYPATVSILSECVYAWNEVLCMDCWIHYRRTGTRRPPQNRNQRFTRDAPAEDDLSDEYSPYLIHS